MGQEDNAAIREQIRLLLAEASALRRGWKELLPELDTLGWNTENHEIVGRIRAIIEKLETGAAELEKHLAH